MLGLAVISTSSIGLNYLFPVTRAYTQLSNGSANTIGEPSPTPWARLNHTLVATGNNVESLLMVDAVMEPDPLPSNVTIRIGFEPLDFDPAENLVPIVTDGDLVWSGEMHQGQSVMLRTTLKLASDGRYFIGGFAVSSASWATMGAGTRLYVDVQWGAVVRVYSELHTATSNELEGKCIANC